MCPDNSTLLNQPVQQRCRIWNSSNEIDYGTTLMYKCDKYFKPYSNVHNGAMISCMGDGNWANEAPFKNFHCEIG